MSDSAAWEEAEEAWEEAEPLLPADAPRDADALAVLERAEQALRPFGDDDALDRRADLLELITICHCKLGDKAAAARAAAAALDGSWPEAALASRLNAVAIAASYGALPGDQGDQLTDRAIELAAASTMVTAHKIAVSLMRHQAYWALEVEDAGRAAALLRRVEQDFADTAEGADDQETAWARSLEGYLLLSQPGQVEAAEAAFRKAVELGDESAWLDVAVILSWQAGREDDEEAALRAAFDQQTDPERAAQAAVKLGCFLLYIRDDRNGARSAFGRATTGAGEYVAVGFRQLIEIAALDGDEPARRELMTEYLARSFSEFDPDAKNEDHPRYAACSKVIYHPRMIARRRRKWLKQRRQRQQHFSKTGSQPPS